MNSRKNNIMLAMAMGALLTVAAPAAFTAEKTPNAKEITRLAQAANSPADHTRVAQMYLERARSLESQADKLEGELRKQQSGPTAAMEQKWPGLMSANRDRKERLAVQARRAAQEAQDLALHHSKLGGRTLEQITAVD